MLYMIFLYVENWQGKNTINCVRNGLYRFEALEKRNDIPMRYLLIDNQGEIHCVDSECKSEQITFFNTRVCYDTNYDLHDNVYLLEV